MRNLAVLLSGSGSNFQAMLDRKAEGRLDVDFKVCVSNKPDAYGLERARQANIPAVVVDHRQYDSRQAYDAALVRVLREHEVEFVAMAGFMRIVTATFLDAFPGRVLNIHPALLPSFPGAHGQRDAAQYGVAIAGCTVHVVDEEMDHGPIVIQAAIPVQPGEDGDSLAKRILTWEHRIFSQALHWMATGRLRIENRHVFVDGLEPEASCVQFGSANDATASQLAYGAQFALVNPPLEAGF